MEFNPNNPIIQLCLRGMELEAKGLPGEAAQLFKQAWNEADNALEKYMAAYYIARNATDVPDKLQWYHTSLENALSVNDPSVNSALTSLYTAIAQCYEDIGDPVKTIENRELAISSRHKHADKGPFYHGTKADLKDGDLLTAGYHSNYKADLLMNHIYFTALLNGAGLAAALAKGEGSQRIYIVEPVGAFEDDPNVTDKKFPGNPTRSYRTQEPLKIVGEVHDWERISPEQLAKWQEKLANTKGDIIN